MAVAAVIGALRVVLGADTAAFETGLKRAQGQASSFAAGITKIAAGVGAFVLLEKAVESVVGSFKDAITRADDLGKAAQKVGLPVEEFTKLKLAADLSDVSMQSLSAGLGKLSQNMLKAAQGSKEQREQFEQLGIKVRNTDGSLRSVGDVFADLSGKFASASDGAAKTATAINLLGRGGKDLVPLLNEGKASLVELTKTAERMGLVISTDTANASQKFNDNLKIMSKATEGIANLVMAAVIPALLRLSEEYVTLATKGDLVRDSANRIIDVTKSIVEFFAREAVAVHQLGNALGALKDAFISLGEGTPEESIANFRKNFAEVNRINSETPALMDAAGKAAESYFTKITVGGQAAKANPPVPDKTETDRWKQVWEDITEKSLKFYNDTRTPAEEYAMKQAEINHLMEIGAISADTYGRAMQQAAEKANATWDLAGASIAGSFAKIAGSFGDSNKEMALIGKAFAIVQATISVFTGMAKALELPFPANLAAAAAVAAKGFAFVAAIKGSAIPSFAEGGSFKIPGGSRGSDNMLMPMVKVASGERVDITPADQARGGRGVQEIVLRSPRARDFFADHVRDLTEVLNLAAPDGYRLKFADHP